MVLMVFLSYKIVIKKNKNIHMKVYLLLPSLEQQRTKYLEGLMTMVLKITIMDIEEYKKNWNGASSFLFSVDLKQKYPIVGGGCNDSYHYIYAKF